MDRKNTKAKSTGVSSGLHPQSEQDWKEAVEAQNKLRKDFSEATSKMGSSLFSAAEKIDAKKSPDYVYRPQRTGTQSPRQPGDDPRADELFKGVDKERNAMEKRATEERAKEEYDMQKFAESWSEWLNILASGKMQRDGMDAEVMQKYRQVSALASGSSKRSGFESSDDEDDSCGSEQMDVVDPQCSNPFKRADKNQK